MLKFAKEPIAYKNDKVTLSVTCEFNPVSGANETDTPLHIYDGLSRFVFTAIVKNAKNLIANFPVDKLEYLEEMFKIALNKSVEAKCSTATNAEGIAYTVRISAGSLKGKTPAEILAGGQREALEKQRDWLQQNVGKYAANQTQINAIDEAIRLYESGQLVKTESGPVYAFDIIEPEYKYRRTKNDAGHNLVYSIGIRFDSSRNYPISIEIINCYAPVVTRKDKTTIIKLSESYGEESQTIHMKMHEFSAILSCMKRAMNTFEMVHSASMWKLCEDNSFKPDPNYNQRSENNPTARRETEPQVQNTVQNTASNTSATNTEQKNEIVTLSLCTAGSVVPKGSLQLVPIVNLESRECGNLYFRNDKVELLEKAGFWKQLLLKASSGVQLKIKAEKKGLDYLFLSSAS